MRKLLVVALVWAASLVGTGLWAQGRGQNAPMLTPGDKVGPIVTGADLGFQQIVSMDRRAGVVTGTWMVRINGEWFPTAPPVTVSR